MWCYDGVSSPQMLFDINEGERSSYPLNHTCILNEKLYFSAETEEYGIELWIYDGRIIDI